MMNSATSNNMMSSASASGNNAQSPGLKTYFKTPEGKYKLQYEKTHPAIGQQYSQGKTVVQVVGQVTLAHLKDKPMQTPSQSSSSLGVSSGVRSAAARLWSGGNGSRALGFVGANGGNICFSSHTSKQDVDVNEPAYFELSHSVDEKLLASCNQISDRKATVDHVLHDLFQHGDSAQKYIKGSKSMRIENTILLDNYVGKRGFSNLSRAQVHHKSSKRSKKRMSLKQHKKKGTFDMPEEELHSYKIFESMHERWKSYILRLLNNVGKDQLAQGFLNADLHGATILVVRCKIVAYIGTYGIMIRETEQTFGIISQDNKFRVVPKKLSVFVLQADCWKFTLLGDRLESRRLIPGS